MLPYYFVLGIWAAWWISWWASAGWSAKTEARLPVADEARHRVFLIAGIVLLFLPLSWIGGIATPLWPVPGWLAWALVAVTALGFGFCWWARVHLGRLWSGAVTRKEGHHIVDTGPYRYVRHPIYTGILTAVLATMLLRGTALGIAGAALIIVSLTMKARFEEKFLSEQLGPEAYSAYRARVPMLVPFWPVRS